MGKYNYKAERLAWCGFLLHQSARQESVLSVFRIFGTRRISNPGSRKSTEGGLNKRRALCKAVVSLRVSKFYGQATKGARWMPWQKQAMKDVASCDKLRGAAHRRYIRRFPNGETHMSDPHVCPTEYIGRNKRTEGSEPSQYLQEKKETSIPIVVASELGTSPNPLH